MNFDIELALGGDNIIGIDEAGRGPLAGPVVAAAVILPSPNIVVGINDSKKLSPARRSFLYEQLITKCIYAVGIASPEEIDEYNILKATMLAMRRARDKIAGGKAILIDGNANPFNSEHKAQTVIGGDAKSLTIAAASIIAKVTRDRIMDELHNQFPQYGWIQNKGYGTATHRAAIHQHGITPIHRRSFMKKLAQKELDWL